ncbi:phosphate ABC transporter substrate-binding protein (PhoT family) [Streptomyces sp. 1114.5]|uniref:phosphate ABC transporter substrate-binding protein PstS n=1 Tax=unclassified Streptomyces TaxID=2593676 RepID=UPI000BCDA3C1|nr:MULTISPECIES: phosphate ABC transporter substrate-binding protein PstS [unclassified Streptomyces]RKT16654.1 phosphate ABC transporter substrate-binding protein (PhoT family) [Streptomyces sp. 1114.5]SOB82825.1 phosphate ABC transporter substrate-binding protein, PhoT family [Streptomyces sp. 1331.2]
MFREAARRSMARLLAGALSLSLATASLLLGQAPAQAASVSLSADGSSWAGPAIDQWRQDVSPQGIQISFNPVGSAAGRTQWSNGQDDFTASDVPFRSTPDTGLGQNGHASGGGDRENPVYGFSYVPITAGGTTFMYNLVVGGKQVRDLRLSPQTIVDIFTGKITNWNDPKVTADYGRALPNLQITPVVRSDGSGATAQFTRWMEHTHKDQWDAYCTSVNGVSCGDYTEFFPPSGRMVAQNGSDVVAGYIKSPGNLGTIGYDEYAFAKRSNWPVVKVLNQAGYYALPTASNVAVALTAARIRGVDDSTPPDDPNYLQQNLDGVYTMNDPRAYPISSYSYLIVPRAGAAQPPPPRFNNDKGSALSRFLSYVLCEGQGKADDLGYSPIPRGLVKGGLLQTRNIPGNASPVNPDTLSNCANPTFNPAGELTVLKNAPMPSECDKQGAPLNCVVQGGKATQAGSGGSGTGNGAGSGGAGGGGGTAGSSGSAGGSGSGGNGSSTGGAGTGGAAGAAGGDPNATGGAAAGDPNAPGGAGDGTEEVIDPQTGQVVARGRGGATEVAATVVEVSGKPEDWTLATLTAVELLAVVLVPPLLGRRLLRRRNGSGGAS